MIDLATAKPRDLVDMIPSQPIPVVQKILAEKSLKQFVKQAWHVVENKKPLIWNWHLDVICDHLEAVTNTYIIKSNLDGKTEGDFIYVADHDLPIINYLWINMPPRHTKSLIASVFWPCWEWGPQNLPQMRYIFTTYTQPLSTRDSVKRRNIMRSRWYQSNWGNVFQFKGDQNAKTRYENSKTGYMISTSFDGIGTGEGGDRIVADDPHSVKEVESEIKRESKIATWDDTFSSRLDDDYIGAYVGVMQRTHHKDLTGHILDKYNKGEIENLVNICLPARYESDHPVKSNSPLFKQDPRTEEGEALDKNRWPDDKLRLREGRMTAWAVAGQLQQRPHPKGGAIIPVNRIKIVDNYNHRQVKKIVRYWDKAASLDKSSSYTATVLMALMREDCEYGVLILDAVRGQWTVGDRDKRMRQIAEMDGIETQIFVEQEPGSGGKESAISSVKKVLFGFKCSPDRPTGAKEVRLEPFAGQVENNNVAMLKGEWNKDYIGSLEMCTTGNVTDYGDATSGAFNAINGFLAGQKAKVRFSIR